MTTSSPEAAPSDPAGASPAEFRRAFRSSLGFDIRTGILLVTVFGVIRVVLVLQANVTGSYQAVSILFVVMAALPWILLTRPGPPTRRPRSPDPLAMDAARRDLRRRRLPDHLRRLHRALG